MKKVKENEVNTVGSVFNVKKAVCRDFDISEIHGYITDRRHFPIVASWAFEKPVVALKNKCYQFKVHGHHHKGYVYIVLNFLDLFTIYYTDLNNVIQKVTSDVYIMELLETLDKDIEKISEYSF